MEWWQILLVVLSALAVLTFGYYYLINIRNNIIIKNIQEILNTVFNNPEIIKESKRNLYQIKCSTEKDYLIKILTMSPKHELIITNSNKAIINDDPKNWKRSAKPSFVSGIKQFSKLASDKKLIKIVLVYPDCHNITKYLNESDIIIVDSDKLIDDMYYVKFNEFKEFLKNH